jgi:hypothetical protein
MAADKAELRGLAPIDLVKALDALAQADGLDRTEYVNQVLHAHVVQEVHRTSLRLRMLRGNPYLSDSAATASESPVCGGERT